VLRGGTISENTLGVEAYDGGTITVAQAEEDGLPQTVSKDNARCDWQVHDPADRSGGEIIGIPPEKINVRNNDSSDDGY